jgi:hypothetical protein
VVYGKLLIVQYFLQEAGASINDATHYIIGTCCSSFRISTLQHKLASLLKVMVMLYDDPIAFVAKLSPAHAKLAAQG